MKIFLRILSRIGLSILLAAPAIVSAQSRQASVVDVVSLKSGRSWRGAVLQRHPDGTLSMAVSRSWLQKSDPRNYDKLVQGDSERQRAAWRETADRITAESSAANDSAGLTFLFKQEHQRLERLLADPAPPELPFIVLDFPATQKAKVTPAPLESQRIAMFAWDQGLAGVETRPADALRKELEKRGIDVKNAPVPDLADQVPSRPQSDEEWAARMAVIRYTLNEPLDFQGMDGVLVRTEAGQPVDFAALLPQLVGRQLDSVLGDLFETNRKPTVESATGDRIDLKTAIAEADRRQSHGFRVTLLKLDPERLRVAVETRFVAELTDAGWQTIWTHTESADGNQSRPDLETRITADPQVKSAFELMKGAGLAGDDLVSQAVRIGAATMAAQTAADGRFFEFRDRYSRRLDGPVLPLPAGK